jgi:ribosome-associated heat shock protein Hsp15
MSAHDPSPLDRVRLDVWLDVSCLFKTRSEAQRACQGGKVQVNGERAKPHRFVKPGDAITLGRVAGRKQQVVVRGLADRHIAKALARELYEDVTPPPTQEEIDLRGLESMTRPVRRARGAPDKRARRELRRLKGHR